MFLRRTMEKERKVKPLSHEKKPSPTKNRKKKKKKKKKTTCRAQLFKANDIVR